MADFWLQLRPLPPQANDPPMSRRVTAVLKFALRACRFRCVSIRTDGAPGEPQAGMELRNDCEPASTPPDAPIAPQRGGE